ncbi:MAG: monovalent cation/H(+) antiporter subunit G [Pseudomonadota bacterium]
MTFDPLTLISGFFVLGGSFFVLVGALGFIRMPDVYTRMHAASVIETLGAGMLIMGMLIEAPNIFVAFKLLVTAALLFFFGPVASHAIAQSALAAGVAPKLSADRRGLREGEGEVPGRGRAGTGREASGARLDQHSGSAEKDGAS